MKINPRETVVRDLLEDAIKRARISSGEQREISIHVPRTLPMIHVGHHRLCQAVTNLVSNAFKFTSNGEINIYAWLAETGGVTIAVSDTGIGMAQEKVAKALQPFQQLDASLARKFDGLGLGLTLTKALVELHGGQLQIDSVVGEGTTARIVLPAERTLPQQFAAVGGHSAKPAM